MSLKLSEYENYCIKILIYLILHWTLSLMELKIYYIKIWYMLFITVENDPGIQYIYKLYVFSEIWRSSSREKTINGSIALLVYSEML